MTRILEKYTGVLTAALLWLSVFLMYLKTLAPTVGFIDSGELAAVAQTLGIAHPTGYPLFTLLGRVFANIPTAAEEIVRLNIFSAVMTSLAAVIFYFLLLELFSSDKKNGGFSDIISALLATLFLAFSKTFWMQGVSLEVYSLHLFFLNAALLLFVKAVKEDDARWWFAFAFVVGLSFTNHLTTVLLAPALLFWFFAEHGLTKSAVKRIGMLAVPFAAGLSVYLFLPIRALQQPLLNWGNPISFEKFWWHFTGKQFRVWMFSSSESANKQLDYFFSNLTNEFHVGILIAGVIGAFVLLLTDRTKIAAIVLLFVSCVAYSINYDIHDIDSYFLLAYVAIAIVAGFGIRRILSGVEAIGAKVFIVCVFLVVLSVQISGSKENADQSKNFLVEDYTKTILLNLPPNAIVLSYQWDYFVAASYYFQHVENIRPDVIVLDKELFRRSWYFSQLKNMYPDLMRKSARESALFLQELDKFEHDEPYDFSSIEGRYTDLLKSFIAKNDSVDFFVTPEIEPQYTSGYHRIPEGFLFRLSKDTAYTPTPVPEVYMRGYAGNDAYSKGIVSLQVNALKRRGAYEQFHLRDSLAVWYSQKASEILAKNTIQVSNF